MPVTQANIDALNQAIRNAEKMVRSDGIQTEYRSVAELIRARDDLVAQLAGEVPARIKQTILVHGGRGFDAKNQA